MSDDDDADDDDDDGDCDLDPHMDVKMHVMVRC